MHIEDIKDFLRSKPGYLKEGAGRLSRKLNCPYSDCRTALKEVRREVRNSKPKRKIKRLFYDIETSYNIVKSWRVGFNLNIGPQDIIHERAIICISYKWEGEDKVSTLIWNDGCDKKLVEAFVKIMAEADELVGHNIDRYDTKFLMTRAITHGILGLPKYNSFDTLKKAKKHFNFNSNKLDYIAKLIGLDGKLNHEGLKMWDDIVLYSILNIGTKKQYNESLSTMVEYCEQDVILTEEVYNKLRMYSEQNMHHGVLNGGEKFYYPNCGSENISLVKTTVTKMGTIKRSKK